MYQISKEDLGKVLMKMSALQKQIDSIIKTVEMAINRQGECDSDKEYEDPDEYLKSWSDAMVFGGDPDNYEIH